MEEIQSISIGWKIFRFFQKINKGIKNNVIFWITNKKIGIKISAFFLIEEDYKKKNFQKIINFFKKNKFKNFEKHDNYITYSFLKSENVFRINYLPHEITEVSEKEKSEILIELINDKTMGFRELSKLDNLIQDFERTINIINSINFKICNSYNTVNLSIDMEYLNKIQKLEFKFLEKSIDVKTKNNLLMINMPLVSNFIKNIKKVICYWNSIR